jgi:hypothetical protein
MDRNNYIEIHPTHAQVAKKSYVKNVFCIVSCKEDYDNLKLACKPIFQKIETLCEKASIEVEGKHFDLDILMGGDIISLSRLTYAPVIFPGILSKIYKLLISSRHWETRYFRDSPYIIHDKQF